MAKTATAPDAARHGWRMVAICFVILNFATGIGFASYGALVEAIQREFDTSRALASSGLSMLTLALGLLSPLVGVLMRRVPLKLLMVTGIILNAAGFGVISQTSDIRVLLASYALLIGPGFCLYSIIPCATIVGHWFVQGRGKALGIINMPLGNAAFPMAAAVLLSGYGLHFTFAAGAIAMLTLIPLVLILVERPEKLGLRPVGDVADEAVQAVEAEVAAVMTTGQILRSVPFLIVSIAVGTLSAAGLVMVTQLVALGTGRGLDLASASLLLAAFGLSGMAGAPIFGWLADRLGGRLAFASLAFALIIPWLALLVVGGSFPLLLLLALLIGACCNGVVTLFSATLGEWLGQENLALAMGLCYMLQIPFLFGAAPLAGAMFDATGGYTATILLHAASFAVIGVLFMLYRPPTATSVQSRPATA